VRSPPVAQKSPGPKAETNRGGDPRRTVVGLDQWSGPDCQVGIPGFLSQGGARSRRVHLRAARGKRRAAPAGAFHQGGGSKIRCGHAPEQQRLGQWRAARTREQRVEHFPRRRAIALKAGRFDFRRRLFAERLDDRRLIALSGRIPGLAGGTHAARRRDHLQVYGKGTARHIILGEGDLDALVQGIASSLFMPAHGIQIRQRRLAPQIEFSP
jgi:hypothetical protein